VPFDRLTNAQKLKVNKLSQRLTKGDVDVFPDVDSFFADLYGLNGIDLEVINDTLEVCLPYDESRRRASDRTSSDECEIFRQRLQTLLTPVFHVMNKEPSVRLWQPPDSTLAEDAPFRLLLIEPADNPIEEPAEFLLSQVLALSNETGVTRVFLTLEDGLIVGILNQYRYWTPSRARLLAAEILRRHTTIFETQADVARVL
jgi:hypothetical protein